MIRAFLALELDDMTRSALAVQQFLLPLPRQEPVENLHLTLVFLGEVREPLLEDLHLALQAVRAAPFALSFAGLGLFGGTRPRVVHAAVAPNPALLALQKKIASLAGRSGIAPDARRFVPHVTLGRFPPPPPEEALRLERAVAAQGGFRAGPMPVREVTLFESIRHRDGARYEVLARYPL